ncbi:hypothetical protein Hanom_Chr17g01539941 [Helianthus anomalus]
MNIDPPNLLMTRTFALPCTRNHSHKYEGSIVNARIQLTSLFSTYIGEEILRCTIISDRFLIGWCNHNRKIASGIKVVFIS